MSYSVDLRKRVLKYVEENNNRVVVMAKNKGLGF
jgi:hypothetical protein